MEQFVTDASEMKMSIEIEEIYNIGPPKQERS